MLCKLLIETKLSHLICVTFRAQLCVRSEELERIFQTAAGALGGTHTNVLLDFFLAVQETDSSERKRIATALLFGGLSDEQYQRVLTLLNETSTTEAVIVSDKKLRTSWYVYTHFASLISYLHTSKH